MARRSNSDEVTVITTTLPHSSPSIRKKTHSAFLIVLSGSSVGKVYELNEKRMVVGRDDSADVQILDAGISRIHCTLFKQQNGSHVLEDAGSKNGTFINNRRIKGQYQLQDGDKIQVGAMTIFKFSHDDEVEASYAQKMYDAALRDGLTGAFNRRYFDERLASEFSFAIRHKTNLGLLMIDLDHFKLMNDRHGHLVGDQILREFGGLVLKIIRIEDVLARYGGEEFAVICRDTDLMKSSILAERIRHDAAAHHFFINEKIMVVTSSIGVVALPDSSITSPQTMVEVADEALYQAKAQGRNCVITRRPRN
ncbi:MAG: GGDEF domain-containing protein [Pseudomonadota bacterium]